MPVCLKVPVCLKLFSQEYAGGVKRVGKMWGNVWGNTFGVPDLIIDFIEKK